ncbi:ABC transporter substrate-binding protein [Azotosporobacter soli]|uniref:ABC transporter substrate-binding protein n=1 Tax=Azotosporobacter soli TaxID=3055040 RepID=UPI0031FEA047
MLHRIGILQLTQYLDEAVQGFKTGLSEKNIAAEFLYYNADGNEQELPALARKLKEAAVEMIFACSTPAALAAIQHAPQTPVIFTPVFDPVGTGLVNSLTQPGGWATGAAGRVAAAEKINFIRRLLPDARSIGCLYHLHDANAVLEVAGFRALELPFSWQEIPFENPAALSLLPDLLPENIDALFLPIGRAAEDNFASIVYYTDSVNLPVIASHPPNVAAGALAALTANHFRLGITCAEKAAAILGGTPIGSISISQAENPDIILNRFSATNLGIELPADLIKQAKEIID